MSNPTITISAGQLDDEVLLECLQALEKQGLSFKSNAIEAGRILAAEAWERGLLQARMGRQEIDYQKSIAPPENAEG